MKIADLHCDLLSYLALASNRKHDDPASRCSSLQLRDGNVTLQITAIAAITDYSSVILGEKQIEIFEKLPSLSPDIFTHYSGELNDKTSIIGAIENASIFSLEHEPLDLALKRFEEALKRIPLFYVSLTWAGENRFAGGNGSQSGLKEDGRILLDFLSGKKIAIDFSHTSDATARDILNYIDKKKLDLPVMASHSNFRAVHNNIRNLPEDVAEEIIKRDGIIGLVLYSKFLRDPNQVSEHIEYAYKLGGEKSICFGSDFFCFDDIQLFPTTLPKIGFFDEISDASKFPSFLTSLQEKMQLPQEKLEALSHRNVLTFLERFHRGI